MKSLYKKNAYLGILYIPLILTIIVGIYVYTSINNIPLREPNSLAVMILLLLAYVSTIWGIYNVCKLKGYSGWFALFGLIGTFGLIAILILPNKSKRK